MHNCISLPSSSYVVDPAVAESYEDVFKLLPIYKKFLDYKPVPPVILSGPKGTAKSLSIHAFAASEKIPLVSCDCSEDMRRTNLLGSHTIRGDQTPFVLGPLPSAIQVANEVGSCILCLEEINALSPASQKLLNPLCDFRRQVSIPESEHVFTLKPDAKLWVVGTMNAGYGGTFALNEDLISRFRILPIKYPDIAAELRILKRAIPDLNVSTAKSVLTLAQLTRQGQAGYALSTRDVVQIVTDIAVFGVQQAVHISSGKFEGSNQDTFNKWAVSTLGKGS